MPTKSNVSLWLVRLSGAGFAALLLCGVLIWNYGSVQSGFHVAHGESLILKPEVLDLGTISSSETIGKFRCVNLSNSPVELLGGSSDCPCVVLDKFPQTIPPKGELVLSIRISVTNQTAEDFPHKIVLYTDANKKFSLVGQIIGKVNLPQDTTINPRQ